MSERSRRRTDYVIVMALVAAAVLISIIFRLNWPQYAEWLIWIWLVVVAFATFLFVIFPLPVIVIRRRILRMGTPVVPPDKLLEAENSVRTGLLQAVGAIILASGIIVTLVQISITSHGAQDQLSLALKGQVSDRFTAAITQLGDSNIDVRLGGVYSIDRIALDSEEYKPTLVSVLSAFVRRNTARARDKDGNYAAEPVQIAPLDVRKPDVQAAISVLGEDGMPGSRLNGSDIQGVDLSNANVSVMDFSDTEMTYANLRGASGVGGPDAEVVFDRSFLYGAQLDGAALTDVSMTEVDLTAATFRGASLTRVDFSNAVLADAKFEFATLDHVNFTGVDLATCTGITRGEYDTAIKNDRTSPPAVFASN